MKQVRMILLTAPFLVVLAGLLSTIPYPVPAARGQSVAPYGSAAYSVAALSNTPNIIKAAPGLLTSFNCYNPNAAVEYLQFADAAVQVMALTGTTNGTTANTSKVLHFAATPTGVAAGQEIVDTSTGSAIAAGAQVVSFTATTVTMSADAVGGGVGGTDGITFFTPSKMAIALAPSTVSNSAWMIGVGFPFDAISVAATSSVTTYGGAPGSALACTFTYN